MPGNNRPFEGGGELPNVVWVHASWVLVQCHQEDVLLLVGGVEGQDTHHDEVCDGRSENTTTTGDTQAPPTDHRWSQVISEVANLFAGHNHALRIHYVGPFFPM